MAITKTKFINYSRCPRYVALDKLKTDKLESDITLEEYRNEEKKEFLQEILGQMFDEDNNDLIDVVNENLEVMMPYYNKIELLAGDLAPKYFDGKFTYAWNTQNQESFDATINNIKYLCYVDIYNELEDHFNIIEVKATTTNKFLSLGKKSKEEIISIFKKGKDKIYHLLEEDNLDNITNYMDEKSYYNYRDKLFDKYSSTGHYVFDLAVQRYIIENDLKQNNMTDKILKIKYYLAVLNSNYIFDGTYKELEPLYNTDLNDNDIICYFDMTKITEEWQDKIDLIRQNVEKHIYDTKINKYPIGEYCEYKKTYACKYFKICSSMLPKYNSILNYIDNHHGFKDLDGNKYNRFDLIKDGMYSILDVPKNYLNRDKNKIQREVVETDIPYIDIEKIKDGLSQITYPVYHLDFETFPCPLPRYKGEKCYTQSVFQFSLHIEKEAGVCDKKKDHYSFLASNHNDFREELIKSMIKWINTDKGTILVYNEIFEKGRLTELSQIFPQYKKELLKMRDMIFDLLYVVKTKSSLYEELGYDSERAKMFNYYHKNMSGSFSIKKILPLFTNLDYSDLEVSNGMEALVTYAKFSKIDKKQFDYMYKSLEIYCEQDTWAMVEILKGLRNLVVEYNK